MGVDKVVDEQQASDAAWPGVELVGVLTRTAGGYEIAATATNSGATTYRVQAMCVPPWTESMTIAGESVQHQEPRRYCAAFGLGDFAPGDEIPYNTAWNMTLWHDDGTLQDAPPGTYSWRLHFELFRTDDERDTLDLVFSAPAK